MSAQSLLERKAILQAIVAAKAAELAQAELELLQVTRLVRQATQPAQPKTLDEILGVTV